MSRRPNYGLDAPVVLRRLVILGALAIVLRLTIPRLVGDAGPTFLRSLEGLLSGVGIWFLVCAGVMLWGSKVGKFRLRDRLMNAIPWRGDEKVLDVGCGRGLLVIAAAKRLTTGRAIGVDIWRDYDQADNSSEATLENVTLEGVADRVEIQTGDARKLPFEDHTFDVVVSSLALHNIENRGDRETAIREVVRVLNPGGHLAIVDIWRISQYRRILRECGMSNVTLSLPSFHFVVPSFLLTAVKPGQAPRR